MVFKIIVNDKSQEIFRNKHLILFRIQKKLLKTQNIFLKTN
jgi:hypothetical protein